MFGVWAKKVLKPFFSYTHASKLLRGLAPLNKQFFYIPPYSSSLPVFAL